MKKFTESLERKLIPVANKVSGNKYLKTISGGSMSLLAVIMTGAIFSIFSNISWLPYTTFMEMTGLGNLVSFIPMVTTELLSLYMVFSVGYTGAKTFGYEGNSYNIGILSLVSFMMLVPFNATLVEGSKFIDISYLGTKGVFVALLTGVIVSRIICFLLSKKMTIKMPNGVPQMVSDSFTALIPAFIIVFIFALIKVGFSFSDYGTATDFIYKIIQTPLQALTGSLPAFLLCILIAQILWFFGIHGSFTVLPILFPIWIGFMGENIGSVAAGNGVVNPLNVGMWDLANLGGSGATLGLVILMFFFSKSKQYRSFGKITMPCGLFSVNEPVIFGMPIMLNPIMLIPFVITPIIIVSLAYALINLGVIVAPIGVLGAGSLPPFISGLVQGSWTFAIYQVIAVFLSMLIYYPFFRTADKIAQDNELKEASIEKETV